MNAPKKILIVEDERSLRGAVGDTLRRKGFSVSEAKNGKEGVEMALRDHPDFILLDIMMPGMDGASAIEKIRGDEWGKQVPIIIMTNKNATDEALVNDVLVHNPIFCLIKADWKVHDIADRIEEMLVKKQ